VDDDPGQRDPDVAVEEALVGRPRRGVVVDAGALDLGAVALGRRVIQGEQQRPVGVEAEQGAAEQHPGEPAGAAAQRGEEVVVGGETDADAGGAEPAGDGAPPLGEEGAAQQDGEPPGESLVE
jgi:hypothetical protein